jgi:hypothetical protein
MHPQNIELDFREVRPQGSRHDLVIRGPAGVATEHAVLETE